MLANADRLDNAGHLIGLAAECAVKDVVSRLRGTAVPHVHFPSLNACIAQIGGRNRLNQIRRAMAQPGQPVAFDDWDIDDRYGADGGVDLQSFLHLATRSWANHGSSRDWPREFLMAEARAPVTFDSALDHFAAVVAMRLGAPSLHDGRFLRDVDGRLAFVLSDHLGDETLARLRTEVAERLGRYASHAPVLTKAGLFDTSIATDAVVYQRVKVASWRSPLRVGVVDRRLVGQDWASDWGGKVAGAPPIMVFHSVKGGVGRSTALAILAADQARRGRNVLVVDLDMEAPGVGSVLLGDEDLPELGVLDWFAETNLYDQLDGALDQRSMALVQLGIAESPLTQGRGAVDVMPALGLECLARPWNVVTKLGRAFIDHPRQGWSHAVRLRQLLATAVKLERPYDVVLVDARAGLAEGSAAALIGLGGTVLCFGVDTPATHVAHRCLFSHLSGLTNSASRREREWRADFRVVHAKAQPGAEARRKFTESVYETFVDEVYDADVEPKSEQPDGGGPFSFDYDDEDAPHWPWPIAFDVALAEFDPRSRPDQLTWEFVERSFGPFLERADALIRSSTTAAERMRET